MLEYFSIVGQVVIFILGSAFALALSLLGLFLIILLASIVTTGACYIFDKEVPKWITKLDELLN